MSETEKILNDIRAYLRISAAATSKAVAGRVLDTYEKALVYSKLDGETSQTKIEVETQIPQRTISDWSVVFVQAGLAAPPDSYNQNYRALFTLQELGIELGMLKRRAKVFRQAPQPSPTPTPPIPTKPQQTSLQKSLEVEKGGTST